MLNLFRTNQVPFGLDISDLSIKFVQLANDGRVPVVQAFSDIAIPKDTVIGDMIRNRKAAVDALKKGMSAPNFGMLSSPYVVASIPETKSFVRVIQMAAMGEEEAKEAVPWEAEAYIPMPVGQVYLDWVILGQGAIAHPLVAAAPQAEAEKSGPKMTVLITASPRDYIDELVSILKEVGLVPVALEVESQATARALVPDSSKDSVLIVDMDSVRTSLIIFDHNILQFTSSLPIAGNSVTESIAQALNLNFDQAEKMKKEFGLGDDPKGRQIKKAAGPILNNLIGEIKNTIRFYEDHIEGGKIGKILLTGGSGKLKHLPSFLADHLSYPEKMDLKVELGNPWIKVLGRGKTPPLSREDSLGFSTAIGLALRHFEQQ